MRTDYRPRRERQYAASAHFYDVGESLFRGRLKLFSSTPFFLPPLFFRSTPAPSLHVQKRRAARRLLTRRERGGNLTGWKAERAIADVNRESPRISSLTHLFSSPVLSACLPHFARAMITRGEISTISLPAPPSRSSSSTFITFRPLRDAIFPRGFFFHALFTFKCQLALALLKFWLLLFIVRERGRVDFQCKFHPRRFEHVDRKLKAS